jgi:hypothetical protein
MVRTCVRWVDGDGFVFDDNNLHFVANDGPGRRVIFTVRGGSVPERRTNRV